jgi:hypothetical protein
MENYTDAYIKELLQKNRRSEFWDNFPIYVGFIIMIGIVYGAVEGALQGLLG